MTPFPSPKDVTAADQDSGIEFIILKLENDSTVSNMLHEQNPSLSFAFSHVDWLIVSKDMVLLSGRELGENVHPEVITFSVAVSSQMAPAFHMIVHAQTSRGEIVSGIEINPFYTIISKSFCV